MKLTSYEPFWLIKNGIIESYPSLKENIKADILIVGGGITGSLIAHQCVADGYNTILIDKREIAHGSTSATTSMLQYEIDVPLYKLIEMIGVEGAVKSYKACYRSIDTIKEIVAEVQSKCGFKKKDSLYFANSQKEARWLEKEYEVRKQNVLDVKWLSASDILGNYNIHQTFGGILSTQGASMDAFQFTHDVLKYNRKKGLKIYDKTELKKIKYLDEGVVAEVNDGVFIEAKKIIYCTGYETTDIIKENFVKLINTYAVVGERYEDNQTQLNDTLFWNTASPYIYMRTTDDNRLLIGGEDERFGNLKKRNNLVEKKAKKLKQYLEKHLPDYDFTIDFSWCGTFGETKDGLPYIGNHKDFKHSYFVLGFGGNGITFSVIGMQMISDMLIGKEHELAQYFKFRR